MRIAVMGAGAVGCYYGGMLARAGHEVTLIGRPTHVQAVQRDGLLLQTKTFEERVRVGASADPAQVRDARLVLFCVKSTDTETAGARIAPHLSDDALVLSLQNGVDNAQRLQAQLRQRVAPAVVYVATEMAGPGHVRHHGRGELVVEPDIATREMLDVFESAGIPLQSSDNVIGALWAKLLLNCAYNPISAITQLPYGRLFEGEGVPAVMRDVVGECLTVAEAAGVSVQGDAWEGVLGIVRTMPTQYSSTAQDLARGRCTEIDHLNGFVLRQGEALGVATPCNRILHALVKLLEGKGEG
ncbi:MAG TPA: 2-dehydropantoate 2-reductase [Burkholderiaceae bacterium]|nr:2-dehydropantoate 2-reductase [Burkholderiaceae bacterium]